MAPQPSSECLTAAIEDRQKEINLQVSQKVIRRVDLVREKEKAASSGHIFGQLRAALKMRDDIKQKLGVPAHIISTQLRPDVVLCSKLEKVVSFIEFRVPWEDSVEDAYELKKINK